MNSTIVTIILRPPAHEAHYHNPESDKLFDEVIDFLTNSDNVKTIILPRDDRQKEEIKSKYKQQFDDDKFCIPNDVVDGLSLMWYSDLVISGGGTMNREAAALGVPVYSIFKGKIGDVDKYLAKTGRLILIKTIEDIKVKIKIKKRTRPNKLENINSLALHSIVSDLENLITEISGEKNVIPKEKNEKLLHLQKKHKTQ